MVQEDAAFQSAFLWIYLGNIKKLKVFAIATLKHFLATTVLNNVTLFTY